MNQFYNFILIEELSCNFSKDAGINKYKVKNQSSKVSFHVSLLQMGLQFPKVPNCMKQQIQVFQTNHSIYKPNNQKCIILYLLLKNNTMNYNTFQHAYSNKLNVSHNQNNTITNPTLHYQSNYQKPQFHKLPQTLSSNIYNPSSINQNYLSVAPALNHQKFSTCQAQTKERTYKTSEMFTAKSMVFTGTQKQALSNFNQKNQTGGLSKLQSMARTVNKNFDDSKGIDPSKPPKNSQFLGKSQEQKPQTNYKNNENSPTQQSRNLNIKKNFLNIHSKNSLNLYRASQDQNKVYKSFIHATGSSQNRKQNGLQFLLKFKKEQEERKQRQLHSANHNDPKHCQTDRQPKSSHDLQKAPKVCSQAHNSRMFHEHSAPDLGHVSKNYHYQPVNVGNVRKNELQNKFQSPNHAQNVQFGENTYSNTPNNKYFSPQQLAPSPTFMKRFASERFDNRVNQAKTAVIAPVTLPQDTGPYGKSMNFAKKSYKVSEQSLATTQQNTPVKQKFSVTPTFFKNRQNKVFSQSKMENRSQDFTPSKSHNGYNDYDLNSSSPKMGSTISDHGSNNSIEYINEDFISQGPKEYSLDDFQLGDKLGKGAFGDVYIARQKYLGFMCVLKKMSKKRIHDQKRQQHVIRELKIQMYLNHKHLTNMYGYFHDRDNIYLILQYLPDGNLSQMKRRKRTSQKQTADIVKQVCSGLSFMHKYNIIHRDIKPQNIFVNQGYMKLGDFGCSVFADGLRKTVVSCLQYSSPQQLNNGYYNEKIDVWGVGILAFQLLTGKSPYEKQILNMVQQGNEQQVNFADLKFPQQLKLSQSAKDFIILLLSVDPIDRLNIEEALQHRFITQNTKQLTLLQ